MIYELYIQYQCVKTRKRNSFLRIMYYIIMIIIRITEVKVQHPWIFILIKEI